MRADRLSPPREGLPLEGGVCGDEDGYVFFCDGAQGGHPSSAPLIISCSCSLATANISPSSGGAQGV